ncbi:MAG: DUF2784 family protein [Planctomycetia bacterium]|nr:DUF2784 family protein [Planctomycetia bacterium]
MNAYVLLADFVVAIHCLYMFVIVVGLFLPYVGWFFRWSIIHNGFIRLLPLLMLLIVVIEAWCGVQCPLTTLENELRRAGGVALSEGTFVGRCFQKILFWPISRAWFKWIYSAVFLLFVVAWVWIPPRFGKIGNFLHKKTPPSEPRA